MGECRKNWGAVAHSRGRHLIQKGMGATGGMFSGNLDVDEYDPEQVSNWEDRP